MTEDCDHNWEYIPDWSGDPSVPNGTFDCSYYQCTECGAESVEPPDDYPEPEPPEPDFDDPAEADFIYDPLR